MGLLDFLEKEEGTFLDKFVIESVMIDRDRGELDANLSQWD